MTNRTETLRPEVKTLAELGNGVGGIKICPQDRAGTLEKILKALEISKERARNHARVAH
ncbi:MULTISPECIES: hypothetical protein [Pseudomonas]|uniref:Uncharacterized protein n=1 Tax=Pseudomonas fluorescens TaxID=294 RepID=A0A5E7WC54_PSEFL|nr:MULTISPECIES: hypothetical protein [Pseudomonas]VVP22887.1 hypothetical protein PS870_03915 [Pseudomonas fluorescens]VVQ32434.1 hypothetical protein PS947_02930 [Pseudomonas fluorescens]